MSDLILKEGCLIIYHDKKYLVKSPINLELILLEDIKTHEKISAKIVDLKSIDSEPQKTATGSVTDLVLISDNDWKAAKRRQEVLAPLAEQVKCTHDEARKAAKKLGLSWRQIYNLLNRYRNYDKQLLALLPQKPMGGKGKSRIHFLTNQIIDDAINNLYLSPLRKKISLVVEEIRRCCARAGLKPPADRTVRRRIDSIVDASIEEKNHERHDSKKLASLKGGYHFPTAEYPHGVWQIDHTPVDIIIVDDVYRKPIGRPYITFAIDVYSRCIPGFCLTLEPPSSLSVGLCLTHAIFNKEEWLSKRDIKTQWPIWGKPKHIYVDNACEFHSEALKRGCAAHGIEISYRPPGQPHYGGIVERVIGTFMQLVHSLPGTTFSNIVEKGNYPSDKKAVLTLTELEYWLTIAITDYYHQKVHRGIQLPPIEMYRSAIIGSEEKPGIGYPAKVNNQQAFLIDFLAVERRTLQKHGFMLDHITYNSSALTPLIAFRKKHQQFLIRRDPRDLSSIYVLEPHSNRYLVVPYRTLSRPTITLWEHRRAIEWLNNKGIRVMNETLIFQAIERMREIIKSASAKTRSARRQQAKTKAHLAHAKANRPTHKLPMLQPHNKLNESNDQNKKLIQPFSDIEIW